MGMKKRRTPWPILIGIAFCLALVGVAIAWSVITSEGWDGLWNRKKGFIKEAQPGAGPIIDEAEKRVKDRTGIKTR